MRGRRNRGGRRGALARRRAADRPARRVSATRAGPGGGRDRAALGARGPAGRGGGELPALQAHQAAVGDRRARRRQLPLGRHEPRWPAGRVHFQRDQLRWRRLDADAERVPEGHADRIDRAPQRALSDPERPPSSARVVLLSRAIDQRRRHRIRDGYWGREIAGSFRSLRDATGRVSGWTPRTLWKREIGSRASSGCCRRSRCSR